MRHFLITLSLILCTCLSLRAQRFTAQIEEVGGGYRLTYTVTSSDAEDFVAPSLSDFDVLSGPAKSTFSSYQFVNGHASHTASTTYTYILSPLKSGRHTIGSASVRVGGRVLKSNAITFNAQKGGGSTGGQQGRGTGRADDAQAQGADGVQQAGSAVTQRDLFITVTPSRTHVREQEAVLLTYKIHARVGVGLSGTQLTTKPDFRGLISQEIPLPGNQIQTELERRGGISYRTGTILQYVVFPQQSGKLVIPSITFDCTVVQQDRTMDLVDAFFNGGGTIGVQVKRSVPVTTLDVSALPQPKPADFSGAVGKFSMDGKVLNHNVRTNDVTTYRITLKGVGNLKLITPPTVNFPSDFDKYDPKTNENTRVTRDGLTGQLTFDYTFVPRNVGHYTIPAVTFTFFDTEAGTYRTLRTQSVELDVAKGTRSNADVDKQLALLRSDIRDIHQSNPASTLLRLMQWGTLLYWIILLLLLTGLVITHLVLQQYLRKRADIVGRKRSGAKRQAAKRLRKAEKMLATASDADFYAEINRSLTDFLTDAFALSRADLSRENVARLLTERGVPNETVMQLASVLDTCEQSQYAPQADGGRRETYEAALQLLETLSKYVHKTK